MSDLPDRLSTLDLEHPIWDRFFMVAPLVVVGTVEEDGNIDLAPKHMAFPMGWENYFGFICSPRHGTYVNARRSGVFTVSFPNAESVVAASLAASPRCEDGAKPAVGALETFPSSAVEGALLADAYLYFECRLERIVEDFGPNCLIVGEIVAAHVDQGSLRAADGDDQDLLRDRPVLAYLHPNRFARIDRTFSFPLPAGFKR